MIIKSLPADLIQFLQTIKNQQYHVKLNSGVAARGERVIANTADFSNLPRKKNPPLVGGIREGE
jgi:hypothetical protein